MFRLFSLLFLQTLILLAHCPSAPGTSFAPNIHGQIERINTAQSSSTALNLTDQERVFLQTHPVIRVGNEDDWPPFDFSIHGQPTGYAIDHLKLLGRRLGISFEYVNGYSWFELLDLFRKKKIDLLPSLWISKSRQEYMNFTKPYLELPYVIVTKKDDQCTQSFDDLKGKSVAVAKGYKQEIVLKSSYPEIETFEVTNALEGMEAVIYNLADAYIGYQGTVAYLMATNFMADLQICAEVDAPELGPQGLYIAVRQDLPLLQSALQKAMDSVTHTEKYRLAQKWITVEKTRVPELSEEEEIFLRQNPVLKVDNLKDWPPFNFRENGKRKGFCIDYMDLLANKLNMEFTFVSGPSWGDFLDMLEAGDIDLLCDVVQTRDRKETIAFTDPYFVIFSGIVVRKGGPIFNSLQSLAGKKVAIHNAFYYQEILERNYPDIHIVTKENTLECLKAVSAGQVDAALAEKPVFDYLIVQHFLTDLTSYSIVNSPFFENTPVSIGVNKDRAILKNILQKTMDTVTEEERSKIYRRWLNAEPRNKKKAKVVFSHRELLWLEDQTSLNMCINPSRLPFEQLTANDEYTGIVAEITALLEERIGLPIQAKPVENRSQELESMQSNQCQLLSCVVKGPYMTKQNIDVSKTYLTSTIVMVTRNDQPYLSDVHALEGKTVGIVKDNPIAEYIQKRYSTIDLQYYVDLNQALEDTVRGKNDVVLGGLHSVCYMIHENGLYDLKIAGQTPYKEYYGFGIRANSPELRSIINKAISSLTDQEINQITRKWLSIRYDKGFDTILLIQILLTSAFVLTFFALWNRKLARLNREIADAHESLALKSHELEILSTTDRLTCIYNRMKLEEVLANEIKRAHRSNHPFSIIMMDVDLFKDVNDAFGHQTGDKVLQELAELLKTNIRQTDTVGRWGGEEFMIICPETNRKGAYILAENLRQKIASKTIANAGHITCSFGIAEYIPGQGENALVAEADKALYQAKKRGRNMVVSD